jgi:hypothetical protein
MARKMRTRPRTASAVLLRPVAGCVLEPGIFLPSLLLTAGVLALLYLAVLRVDPCR